MFYCKCRYNSRRMVNEFVSAVSSALYALLFCLLRMLAPQRERLSFINTDGARGVCSLLLRASQTKAPLCKGSCLPQGRLRGCSSLHGQSPRPFGAPPFTQGRLWYHAATQCHRNSNRSRRGCKDASIATNKKAARNARRKKQKQIRQSAPWLSLAVAV